MEQHDMKYLNNLFARNMEKDPNFAKEYMATMLRLANGTDEQWVEWGKYQQEHGIPVEELFTRKGVVGTNWKKMNALLDDYKRAEPWVKQHNEDVEADLRISMKIPDDQTVLKGISTLGMIIIDCEQIFFHKGEMESLFPSADEIAFVPLDEYHIRMEVSYEDVKTFTPEKD